MKRFVIYSFLFLSFVLSISFGIVACSKPVDPNTTYVYITNSGTVYHQAGCSFLSQSSIKITLSEAKSKGYTPDKSGRCNPPKMLDADFAINELHNAEHFHDNHDNDCVDNHLYWNNNYHYTINYIRSIYEY